MEVVIEPLLEGVNQVSLHAKRGLDEMLQTSQVCVSDSCLPLLVRQKALQANVSHRSSIVAGARPLRPCNKSIMQEESNRYSNLAFPIHACRYVVTQQ